MFDIFAWKNQLIYKSTNNHVQKHVFRIMEKSTASQDKKFHRRTDKKKQPDHKAAAQMQQTICLHL